MQGSDPVLAFDFGSPVASVAAAVGGRTLAARDAPRAAGARGDLLPLVAQVLEAGGLAPESLGGVVAIAGPGSFTGVRIACATALALAQARPMRRGALSTLAALALAAPRDEPTVLAVVDALRGEWFVQPFGVADAAGRRPELAPARLWRAGEPLAEAPAFVVGYGCQRFASATGLEAPMREPRELAAAVALAATAPVWIWSDVALTRPHYLRRPATTGSRP